MEFMCGGSTDGDQRDSLAPPVPHRAQGPRIKRWPPVNQEIILMMPVVKRQTENPASIRHPEHRMGDGIPMVEITHDAHPSGGRRDAGKVHFVEGAFR
jgi:hypothetical protein